MNTVHSLERRKTPRSNVSAATTAIAAPARIHRERDFGVGYGNSSGYASSRRYADSRGGSFFRCR
jgi:post-segregation antitoxin (ccd killing protein)